MTTNINADDGVVSGVAGLKTSADNSGVLALQTNGTTGLTVNASQNVGIGVTPSAWATFKALQNGGTSVADFGGANNAFFGSNAYFDGTVYRYIATAGASSYRQVSRQHQWFTAASGTAGDAISFTQVLSVQEGKSLSLQGATSQTGTGITFPATQSASSDANTLDDYEEGTWTPVVGGVTLTGAGRYTKIGRLVSISFANQSGIPALAVGASMSCTGIPFSVVSAAWANTAIPSMGWNNQSTGFLDELACGRLDPTNAISMYNKGTEATTTLDNWGMSLVYYTT